MSDTPLYSKKLKSDYADTGEDYKFLYEKKLSQLNELIDDYNSMIDKLNQVTEHNEELKEKLGASVEKLITTALGIGI